MTITTATLSQSAQRQLDEAKLLYSVPEAERILSIGRTTIYQEMAAGRIRSVKINRSRRIPADALTEYVALLSGAAQ